MKQNKIYYDLQESEYVCSVGNIDFYFSSPIYLEKFKKNVKKYVTLESSKFVSKYHVYNEKINELLAISYYIKIEKRGCLYKEIK